MEVLMRMSASEREPEDASPRPPGGKAAQKNKHAELLQMRRSGRPPQASSEGVVRSRSKSVCSGGSCTEDMEVLRKDVVASLTAVDEKLEKLSGDLTSCLDNLEKFHQDHRSYVRDFWIEIQSLQAQLQGRQQLVEPAAKVGPFMEKKAPSLLPVPPSADSAPYQGAAPDMTEGSLQSQSQSRASPRSLPRSLRSPQSPRSPQTSHEAQRSPRTSPLQQTTFRPSVTENSLGSDVRSLGSRRAKQDVKFWPSLTNKSNSFDSQRNLSSPRASHRDNRDPEDTKACNRRVREQSLGSGSSDLMQELLDALSRVRNRSDMAKVTWLFLEDPDLVKGGGFCTRILSFLILLSASIPVMKTIEPPPVDAFVSSALEIVLDIVFTVEVIVRFMTCPNRLNFCVSFYNLIDMSAALLALLVRFFSSGTLVREADEKNNIALMVMISALPVIRLLKLLRRFETFHLILRAFRLASEALPVLLFILAVLVLVFASLIYIVEPRENVDSLPRSLWFTIVTVGTIGYGDMVPKSTAGTLVVSFLIVVSALYMAIPIGIVGKAFSTVWDDRDRLLLMHRTRNRFLSRGYKAKDVPAMFFSFDMDGDGNLSLEEFLAMMTRLQIDIRGERLVELFRTFDNDGSGGIDDREFVRTLFPSAYAEIYGKAVDHIEEGEGEGPDPGEQLEHPGVVH